MKPYSKRRYANWCVYRRKRYYRAGGYYVWDIDLAENSKKAARQDGKREAAEQLNDSSPDG